MLSRREHRAWSLTAHENKEYRSEEERRFFENIKNPPPPTEELKEIVREYIQPLDPGMDRAAFCCGEPELDDSFATTPPTITSDI
jgi:hypothetical protein